MKDLRNFEIGKMRVDSITMFESIPTGKGHLHKELWTLIWNDKGEASDSIVY